MEEAQSAGPVAEYDRLSLEALRTRCRGGRGGWTAAQIKQVLEAKGLSTGGNKEAMCQRLYDHKERSAGVAPSEARAQDPPRKLTVTIKKPAPTVAESLPPVSAGIPVFSDAFGVPGKPPAMPIWKTPVFPDAKGVPGKTPAVHLKKVVPAKPHAAEALSEGAQALRAFLTKYRTWGTYVCHTPSPLLEKSHAPVFYCLPAKDLLSHLERLKELLGTLPEGQRRLVWASYLAYRDWIIKLIERRIKGLDVVNLDEPALILEVLTTIPLVTAFYRELKKLRGSSPIVKHLLGCEHLVALGQEYGIGKWYLGVVFRVLTSALRGEDRVPKELVARYGKAWAADIETMLVECLLPEPVS